MRDELLRQGLERLGIGTASCRERTTAQAAELLSRHLAELERWNVRFGFVKASGEELAVKHALDSAAAAPLIERLAGTGRVVDVGSGAGFPGIPLAAVLPQARFTLLERGAKKAAFLENCRALLGLANVSVAVKDLGEISGDFEVVTFRAVAPLRRMLELLGRSQVAWKWLAAYKARRDRIDRELAELGSAGKGAEVTRLEVPFLEEERHLVIVGHTHS